MADDPSPFAHAPVMRDEIVELLRPVPAGIVVDATVGGGGHAGALLEALPHLRVVGLDQDAAARFAATVRLAPYGARAEVRAARFDELAGVVDDLGDETVSGVLFDLGVSSPQLDRPERGFSYRAAGPLDMRMDTTRPLTAADVVNGYDVGDLARVLRDLGDERFAERIARAIVASRPLHTTEELAEVVRSAIPAATRRTGGHPAKRTFQAIRIEVNDELRVLERALDQAVAILGAGGRIVVLSYHSGEDRIVKERLRRAAEPTVTPPPGLPVEPEQLGPPPVLRLLKRGAWTPSAAERAANPRAESAHLRAAEKVAAPHPSADPPSDLRTDPAPPAGRTP